MQADIITIGDEILIGQIVDTNSAYIASALNEIGIRVRTIVSVSDTEEAIVQALDRSIDGAEVVILTGGLGPTKDDITKKCLRDYFGGEYVVDPEAMVYVGKLCERRGIQLSERNRFQAMVPDSCRTLRNRSGSAPGMLFRKEGSIIVSLPGVSFEMKDIMDQELIPLLKKELKLPVRLHKTILTCGIPESTAADKLAAFEESLPEYAGLAYLPSPGILRLRISVTGDNKDYLEHQLKEFTQEISSALGEKFVFGYDQESLPAVVGSLLLKGNFHIAVAESCTGGSIAQMITSVPGSSAYLKGSVTAYANETKVNVLKVSKKIMDEFGAVSREVVEQMAVGVREVLKADFAIATSGIAGPDGGTPGKPVGTVWIAIASPEGVQARKFDFGDNRERNIIIASVTALNMMRNRIVEYHENSV
ncbi:MAG: CinA family nicotinamide mononucleotide deamidase-related protein [Bacteroidales bacterium]|nr:CinA family nicotinamide mononucleotide deamidase-related protein [Bacteroidales bacterium]